MQVEHSFNIYLAQEIGVSKAILLKHIDYWICKNEANKKNLYDGKYWTYNSARAFSKMFPYWTSKSLGRWLIELEKDGWLISGNYNKRKDDKTKWYTRGITLEKWVKDNFNLTVNKRKILAQNEQGSETLAQNEQGSETLAQNEQGVAQNEQGVAQNEQPLPNINQIYKPNSTTITTTTNNDKINSPSNVKEIVNNLKDVNDRGKVMELVWQQILRMTGMPSTSFNLAEQEHLEKHIYGDKRFKVSTALAIVLEAIVAWAISGKDKLKYPYLAGTSGDCNRGIIGNIKQKYLDEYNKQRKQEELRESDIERSKKQQQNEKYIEWAVEKIRKILTIHSNSIGADHFERINFLLNNKKYLTAQIELQQLITEEISLEYEKAE